MSTVGNVKLFLNAPALERLIGGDTEAEVALRHQVVQEFTKHKLLHIVKTEAFQVAVAEIRGMLNAVVKDAIDVNDILTSHLWPTLSYRLQVLVKDAIEKTIKEQIDVVYKGSWERYSREWMSYINRKVQDTLDRNIEEQVKAEVQRRLDKAAKQL